MKNVFKWVGIILLLIKGLSISYGQVEAPFISLKEGEVFDVLLITQKPDSKEEFQAYVREVIPVGREMTYKPLPGFSVVSSTQGNVHPNYLVLAKWDNLDLRNKFLLDIEGKIPDFHDRRRAIWSYFATRYYEIEEETSFSIDKSKYHVATALWTEEEEIILAWEKRMLRFGGKELISLRGGYSPFGYLYDPTIFVISVWDNEAAYEAFKKESTQFVQDSFKHINEFILR